MQGKLTDGARRFDLRIEELPIAALKPRARNARTHSPKQISKIAASIKQFGFVNPVLIDANNRSSGQPRLYPRQQERAVDA